MPNPNIDLTNPDVQFSLLCTYGEILQHEKIIVEAEGKWLVYQVIPPFPTFEEYVGGCEFEEADQPMIVCASLEQAKENLY